jgi:hypothetical protein
VGGGAPSRNTIRVWRERFEEDPQWHPGKEADDAETPGRKKVITKRQESVIAKSAMSLKRKGVEPTVAAVIAQCPAATLNPETDEAFSAKVLLEVFACHCLGRLRNHREGIGIPRANPHPMKVCVGVASHPNALGLCSTMRNLGVGG